MGCFAGRYPIEAWSRVAEISDAVAKAELAQHLGAPPPPRPIDAT